MFLNLVILRNAPRDLGSQDPIFLRVCFLSSFQTYLVQKDKNDEISRKRLILSYLPCNIKHHLPGTTNSYFFPPHGRIFWDKIDAFYSFQSQNKRLNTGNQSNKNDFALTYKLNM
jgi:hypothetical protein